MNEQNNTNGKKIGLLILLLLVAVYLIVTVIFSFIALPGTFLNGRDISYASKEEALASAPKNFNLEISGRDDRNLTIKPEDIDYNIELPKNAKIDQNPFVWPASFLTGRKEHYDFEYRTHYSEDKLDKIIADSKLTNGITEPEDAKIAIENDEFVIKEEVEGNKIDQVKLKKAIIDSINTKNNKIALDDSFYYEPKLRSDSKELKSIVEESQKVSQMDIKFNFNGFDYELSGHKLLDLMDFTDHGYELNYDRVHEYVSQMADQTNTYGKNRNFNATGIGSIVVGPGVYGFKLNEDATIDKIYEMVNARQSGEIEPVYSNQAFTRTDDGGDIGDTYVEVDISRQKMWFYKNGELLIESDLVSGIPHDGWASNVGVGAIQSKVYKTSLKGLNFDRETEYDTKVDYWMPIGWDGEGFHDAPWRGAFGNEIYLSNGSHGCYNLPPSVAKTLFDNVDPLTPVVVYESSTNNSPAMMY